MIYPIIRVHPSTSEHTHYTEVQHAVQWDEITLSEWQSYPDCLAEIKQWSKDNVQTRACTK
jgi:hypothetical protein